MRIQDWRINRISVCAFCIVACAILSLLLSNGCKSQGIDTEKVHGTITYKGQPVEGANVMFTPVDNKSGGSPAVGITDKEGHYVLQTLQGKPGAGTTPGEYIVTVSKSESVPTGEKVTTPEGKTQEVVKSRDVLPQKYKSPTASPLRATVKDGQENKFDFDLTD